MSGKVCLLTAVAISVIAFCAGGAIAADRKLPVTHARGAVHRVISAVPGSVTLYDQNDDDAGVAVISTVFDDAATTFLQ